VGLLAAAVVTALAVQRKGTASREISGRFRVVATLLARIRRWRVGDGAARWDGSTRNRGCASGRSVLPRPLDPGLWEKTCPKWPWPTVPRREKIFPPARRGRLHSDGFPRHPGQFPGGI